MMGLEMAIFVLGLVAGIGVGGLFGQAKMNTSYDKGFVRGLQVRDEPIERENDE